MDANSKQTRFELRKKRRKRQCRTNEYSGRYSFRSKTGARVY